MIGETRTIVIKYDKLADIGVIGMPNAGKSTFIGSISNAKPKVGDYQFTTLESSVGVVHYKKDSLVFADIPGLIEGAHKNKGLGLTTLNEIRKCSILIHLVSMNPVDSIDPYKSYLLIEHELESFGINKKTFIVCSKNDTEGATDAFKGFIRHFKNRKIFSISSKQYLGIEELMKDIFKECI
jgi:GTP-binding protein